MTKKDLKGLTLGQLEEYVLALGEKKFRAKQLFDALYTKEIDSFDAMTTLAKPFRQRLEEIAMIGQLTLVTKQESREDGTTKFLFELPDGKRIESVLIPPRTEFSRADAISEVAELESLTDDETSPEADEPTAPTQRLTLCISTQVGCALDCKFCATATMGFLRNLTTGEIVDQVMQVRKLTGRKITNIVYMGMGEPLMNYDNVMDSVEIISTGLKIAARRISISTAGWVPKIRQMADEGRKVKLAISLHSMDPHAREELMPLTLKYSLDELLDAAAYYYKKIKIRIVFEYILFDGWNDTQEDVQKLIRLTRALPSKVNIIPFHSIAFTKPEGIAGKLHPTPPQRTAAFVKALRDGGVTTFIRSSAGEDIDAACGQLAVKSEGGRTIRTKTTTRPKKPLAAR